MKLLTPGLRLSILLLLTCSALAAMLVQQWRSTQALPVSTAIRPDSAAESETALVRETFAPPAIAAFGEILERPLFTPGREPPAEPEAVAEPVTSTTPLSLSLEGVAVSNQARVAVVRDLSSNEVLRITEGHEHEGWKLELVHPVGATFRQGEEIRELTLIPDETSPDPQ